MPPLSEGQGLQDAIRTTLLQLCKIGVNYQSELSLKGTIGLTIDKREVILVHFNESMENSSCVVDSSQNLASSSSSVTSSVQPSTSSRSSARPTSIIKHTSLSDFGKIMNTETSKLSASLWHSYLMSNNDGNMKEPLPSYSQQLSNSSCGRQIGKIEIPSTSTLYDRLSMDMSHMTDRKDMMSLETITIDLDSESDTFDPPLSFDEVEDEKLEPDDNDKKVEQKQELELLDDADSLVTMSHMDVKTKLPPQMEHTANTATLRNDSSPETSSSQGKDADLPDMKIRPNIPVFVTKSEILDANTTWDGEEHWEDGDCGASVEMLSEADSLNWSKSKYYSCEVCAKQLPSIGKLEAHLVETHKLTESKEFGSIVFKQCPYCGKKFRFQATLDKHLFLHVAKRSYKCNLCSNNYCFPDSLEIHMGAHSGNYSCKKCKKSYSTKTLFQKHIVYMHEQRQHSTKK